MFINLRNALIFRVFASEGESDRKYSLIFWGRTENSNEKSWRGTSPDSSPVSSLATMLIRNKMICCCDHILLSLDKTGGGSAISNSEKTCFFVYCCAHLSLSLDKTGGGSAISNLEKTMFFHLLLRSPFTIFACNNRQRVKIRHTKTNKIFSRTVWKNISFRPENTGRPRSIL